MTQELVHRFYTALAERDGEAMAACYGDDVVFEDPVFGVLNGEDARDMWRMLCASDTDLALTHEVFESTPTRATAQWIARYTFTQTGRPVKNEVTASMIVADEKIVDHRDSFSFWKWSSQALGTPGRLLGWTPMLKTKVQSTTAKNLVAFQAQQA